MQLQNNSYTKQVAFLALLSALAIILGYVEVLIPFSFGIPGVKLGLANLVSLFVLYGDYFHGRARRLCYALVILIVRVLIVGFLFGNLYSIIYGLVGGILSVLVMSLIARIEIIGVVGCSVIGGISHNLGQLLVAIFVVSELRIAFYAPVLLLSGTITGFLIGLIVSPVIRKLSFGINQENL